MDRRHLVLASTILSSVALEGQGPVSGPVALEGGTFAVIRCDARSGSNVQLSLITVQDRKTADEVVAKLRSGEAFSLLARRYSTNPSKSAGGALPTIDVADLRKEFQAVLKTLGPCQPAAPSPGEIYGAAMEDDVATLERLVTHGIQVDQRDGNGLTPLLLAARNGRIKAVGWLVARGAVIDATAPDGTTSLMVASAEGRLDIVNILLKAGAAVNARASDGSTALLLASSGGHTTVVSALLTAGANIHSPDKKGTTPLSVAKNDYLVRVLTRALTVVNQEFTRAVENGDLARVKTLVEEKGVDVNLKAADDQSPLIVAAYKGHPDIVTYLVGRGARVDHKEAGFGKTALMLASEAGHESVVKFLIEQHANVEATNLFGGTALMSASQNGHLGVVKLLVENNARIDVRGMEGQTALMLAALRGHAAVIQYLRSRGAIVAVQDNQGRTALDYAKRARQFQAVAELTGGPDAKLRADAAVVKDVPVNFGTAVLFQESDPAGKEATRLSITIDQFGAGTGGFLPAGTRQYEFRMRITNLSISSSTLGLGPLSIVDGAGQVHPGFIYDGPVYGVNGPLGPMVIIMGETKGEPFGAITLGPKMTIERVHLIVKTPDTVKPSELTVVIGDVRPQKLHLKF